MTLVELLRKAKSINDQFNSAEIPIMKDGLHVRFDLEPQGSNAEGWHIEIVNYWEGKE